MSQKEKYHLRSVRNQMANAYQQIKCYTIDIDLQILKTPITDKDRYTNYLRHLRGFEIKQIKEYQQKIGNDAVLKFRHSLMKNDRRISLKGIVSLLDLTKDIKEEEEEEDDQQENFKQQNLKMKTLKNNKENNNKKIKMENQFPQSIIQIDQQDIFDYQNIFLNSLSQIFDKDFQEVQKYFYQLNNDFLELVLFLQNQYDESYLWQNFEDEILKNKLDQIEEYRQICNYKGWEETQKRLNFIKIHQCPLKEISIN